MKNIKDITISIFAIIGFVAIVSGFTNNETEQTTSASHVWEIYSVPGWKSHDWLLNKKTGELMTIDISTNTRMPSMTWQKYLDEKYKE